MADINVQRGHDATRILTIKDRDGVAIDLSNKTIAIRYKRSDGTGETFTGTCTITDAAAGKVSYTFPAAHFQDAGVSFDVRLKVTAAPAGTDGDFPDGAPLTLYVWQGF